MPRAGTSPGLGPRRIFEPMEARDRLCGMVAALDTLLSAVDADQFEAAWHRERLTELGWAALAGARRPDTTALASTLAALDRRLLAVLERSRSLADQHLITFRIPELERWQHATAAALVGARWGVAGLRTVVEDTRAPFARRYFAFLALAERHPPEAWPQFERYLRAPEAHHAFVAVAVEAARYYPGRAAVLIELFERIRADQLLRRFLGPRLLESLYVLGDTVALPLFEELLVTGHTDPDPDHCEVTRAMVAVRKLTGRLAPSAKYPNVEHPEVSRAIDRAQQRFEEERDRLEQVTVI
jgi:hypothetical protein